MNVSIIFKITVLILLIAILALTIFTTTWMYLRPQRVNGTTVVVTKNLAKMNRTHRPCVKNLTRTSEHRSILNSRDDYSSTESSVSITEINQVDATTVRSTSDDIIRRPDDKLTGQENTLKTQDKEPSIEDGSKSVPGDNISATSSESMKKSEPETKLPPDNALNTETHHTVNKSNEVSKPPMGESNGSGNSSRTSPDDHTLTTETTEIKDNLESTKSSAGNSLNTTSLEEESKAKNYGPLVTTVKNDTIRNGSNISVGENMSTTESSESKNDLDSMTSSATNASNTINPKRDDETEDHGTISTTKKSEFAKNTSSFPSDKDSLTTESFGTKDDADLMISSGSNISSTTIPKEDDETKSNGTFLMTTKNDTAINGSSLASDVDVSTTISSGIKNDIDLTTPSPIDASYRTISEGDDKTGDHGTLPTTTKKQTGENASSLPSGENLSTTELSGTKDDLDSTTPSTDNTFNATNPKGDEKIEDHGTLPTTTKNETGKNSSSFPSDDNSPTTESSGTKDNLNSTTSSVSRTSNITNSNRDARTDDHGTLLTTAKNETTGNGSGLLSDKSSQPTGMSGTKDDLESTASSPSNASNTRNTKEDDESKSNKPLSTTTKNGTVENRSSFPSDEDVSLTKSPGSINDLNSTTVLANNTSNPTNLKEDAETKDHGTLSTTTTNEVAKNMTNDSSDKDMPTTESSGTENNLHLMTSSANNTSNTTNSNENAESKDHGTLSTTQKNGIANNGFSLPSDKDLSTTKPSGTKDDLFSTTSSPSDASTTMNSMGDSKIENLGTLSITMKNETAKNGSSIPSNEDVLTTNSSETKNDLNSTTISVSNTSNTTNPKENAETLNHGTLSTTTTNEDTKNVTNVSSDKDMSTTTSSGTKNDLDSTASSPIDASDTTIPKEDDHGTLSTIAENNAAGNGSSLSLDKDTSTTESSETKNGLDSMTSSANNTSNATNLKGDTDIENNETLSSTSKNEVANNDSSLSLNKDLSTTKSSEIKNDLNSTTTSVSNTSNPTNPKKDAETLDHGTLSTTTTNDATKNLTNVSSNKDMSTTELSGIKNNLNSTTSLTSNTSSTTIPKEDDLIDDQETLLLTAENNAAGNGSSSSVDKDTSTTESSGTKNGLDPMTSSANNTSNATNSSEDAEIENYGTLSTTLKNEVANNDSSLSSNKDLSTTKSSEIKNDLNSTTISVSNTSNPTNPKKDAETLDHGTLSTTTTNDATKNVTDVSSDKDMSTVELSGTKNDLNSTASLVSHTSNATNSKEDAENQIHGPLSMTTRNDTARNDSKISSGKNTLTTESSATKNDLESTTKSTSDTSPTANRNDDDYFNIDIDALIKEIYDEVVPSTPKP